MSVQLTHPGMAPFRIAPRFVGRVWGYQDLRPWYDRVAAAGEPIGEVWLSGDENLVATGPHAGKSLGGLFLEAPEALLGQAAPSSQSPLLIKMIFAREKLSVQVHPDDKLAQKYGQPRGKTECWLTLAAEPGAQVACGLKPGVTLDQVREEIQAGTLEDSLNALPVAAGDMIFVDAGTVHAIWPGSILLETQQNCDLTYRMYDYGRGRELHVEKALEATRLATRAGKVSATVLADRTTLLDVEYFAVERIPVAGSRTSASLLGEGKPALGLAYLFAAAGTGCIAGPDFEPVELPAHGIVAVPAASPAFEVEDMGGLDLIRITPNWPGMTK
ncbi:MAG: class I mannose-6-phosphate isomerase [Terracidiphilus sp.]|nr:class I mannose-6-phosphate isomerase [Terracidiphilus sp.]